MCTFQNEDVQMTERIIHIFMLSSVKLRLNFSVTDYAFLAEEITLRWKVDTATSSSMMRPCSYRAWSRYLVDTFEDIFFDEVLTFNCLMQFKCPLSFNAYRILCGTLYSMYIFPALLEEFTLRKPGIFVTTNSRY